MRCFSTFWRRRKPGGSLEPDAGSLRSRMRRSGGPCPARGCDPQADARRRGFRARRGCRSGFGYSVDNGAPFAGIEAVLQTDAVKSLGVIGVKAGTRSTRQRYSIAHELGHFLNERHEPTAHGVFTCAASDLSNPFGGQRHVRQEREANIFAIELLTPRDRLFPILKRSADLERAITIAESFKVSREAALRRYVDRHRETLAAVFSRDGRVKYVHRPDGFRG